MKNIYILAIQEGHNCTAALLKNGEIICAVSEERFTRIKNTYGFPEKSVEWLLNYAKITTDDLNGIAICGINYNIPIISNITKKNKVTMLNKIFLNAKEINSFLEYKSWLYHSLVSKIKGIINSGRNSKVRESLFATLLKKFNIPKNKVYFIDHHLCHAYSAYYGQTEKGEKALVLTLDGEGDDYSATISVFEGSKYKRIATASRYNSLGYIYAITTKFMGMTPLEHEYKVMGLAPYASTKEKKYFFSTYEKVFKGLVYLDEKNPLVMKSKFPTNRFEHWLKETAVGERFDNLAGALQHFTEEVAIQWVKEAVKTTGIKNVYCGGGVFMNVKMNMLLNELHEIGSIKILPSCGDESNPIGGAYCLYMKICRQNNIEPKTRRIYDLYLGPSFDDEIEEYLKKNNLAKRYDVKKANAKEIAKMLANGKIIARCCGRMEWGARSLGNRCIMANPSKLENIWEINEQIKMRDFWMPFAPTILKEKSKDYVINEKNIEAPYMIMAFRSTKRAKKELRAAMHQADFTLRPQIIEKSWNPEYYKIISEFEKITKMGGILNTSFNLHGKPIVMTPKDAVEEVFEHSGLKHLILGEYLISKKENSS